MADPLQRVTAGKRVSFSARTQNRILDAVDAIDRLKHAGGGPIGAPTNPALVTVRNRSGAAVDWYGVLAIGGQTPVFPPGTTPGLAEFRQGVVIEGVAPTDAGQALCVLTEPAADGEFATATVAGATPVQVNVTDITHRFATTVSGDTAALVSDAEAGIVILSRPLTTGLQWLYVLVCCQDGWAPAWIDPGSGSGSGSGSGGEPPTSEVVGGIRIQNDMATHCCSYTPEFPDYPIATITIIEGTPDGCLLSSYELSDSVDGSYQTALCGQTGGIALDCWNTAFDGTCAGIGLYVYPGTGTAHVYKPLAGGTCSPLYMVFGNIPLPGPCHANITITV